MYGIATAVLLWHGLYYLCAWIMIDGDLFSLPLEILVQLSRSWCAFLAISCLSPFCSQFNHGTEPEVELSFDEDGNCYAYSLYDVPAGSPLRVSYTYGDNTNPSHLLARYGFLEETSPATFCKLMIDNPSVELVNLGYDPARMLFYKDTGDVSEEVWDVLLYQTLASSNPQDQQAFYEAHMNGDYNTKQSMHEHYYPQTHAALLQHIDGFLGELEALNTKISSKNVDLLPRIPLILRHNEFVKNTFLAVRSQLA